MPARGISRVPAGQFDQKVKVRSPSVEPESLKKALEKAKNKERQLLKQIEDLKKNIPKSTKFTIKDDAVLRLRMLAAGAYISYSKNDVYLNYVCERNFTNKLKMENIKHLFTTLATSNYQYENFNHVYTFKVRSNQDDERQVVVSSGATCAPPLYVSTDSIPTNINDVNSVDCSVFRSVLLYLSATKTGNNINQRQTSHSNTSPTFKFANVTLETAVQSLTSNVVCSVVLRNDFVAELNALSGKELPLTISQTHTSAVKTLMQNFANTLLSRDEDISCYVIATKQILTVDSISVAYLTFDSVADRSQFKQTVV